LTNSQNLPKGLCNGYTRISNEILEALMYADLTKREYKICLCILRYGYGYNQDRSEIRCHQSAIAQLTGLYKGDIAYSLKSLENKNIIKWDKVSKTLTFNRHIDTWKVSKTLTSEIKKVSKTLTKKLVKYLHKSKQNTNIESPNPASDESQRASKDILNSVDKSVDNSVDNFRGKLEENRIDTADNPVDKSVDKPVDNSPRHVNENPAHIKDIIKRIKSNIDKSRG